MKLQCQAARRTVAGAMSTAVVNVLVVTTMICVPLLLRWGLPKGDGEKPSGDNDGRKVSVLTLGR